LPNPAASTTSQGLRVESSTTADRAESTVSASRTGRVPKRSAGRRTAQVSAALAASVKVTLAPMTVALMPRSSRYTGSTMPRNP
jgi:hypothetical protein